MTTASGATPLRDAFATITVLPNTGSIAVNVSVTRTMTLSQAPANGLTVSIVLGGTVGHEATVSPSVLTFAPGETTKTFVFTAGPNLGSITQSYVLSGPDAANYSSPPTPTISVFGQVRLTSVPSASFTNRVINASLTLVPATPNGLTVSLGLSGTAAGGSSVSPSSITFAPGEAAAPFTLTVGPNAGTLTLTLTDSGPDVASFSVQLPWNIAISTGNTPVGSDVAVTPTPSAPLPVSVTVTWNQVTANGNTSVSVPAPSSLPAPPSGLVTVGGGIVFNAMTTATVSGTHEVCATYADGIIADETALRLFQRSGVSSWADRTSSIDTAANVICATFSGASAQFALLTFGSAPEVGEISGPSAVIAGDSHDFSATFTDADEGDTHTGTWVWGDGNTSPATITSENGVLIATGSHAFPAGTHQVRLVINDGGQSAASPDFEVVADGAPPVITSLTATPGSLWPPDNKMHTITLAATATDDSGTPPVCVVTNVTADSQPAHQAAFAITGDMTVSVKARPNTAYTITVTCTDAAGRTASKAVTVQVEK